MKANELRIGNWIDYKNTVCQYDASDFWEAENNTQFLELFVKPIPLTEEWLLKFGFKSVNGYPFKMLCGYIKIRNGIWFFKYYNLDIELKYVHQLQNLYFALIGEEL